MIMCLWYQTSFSQNLENIMGHSYVTSSVHRVESLFCSKVNSDTEFTTTYKARFQHELMAANKKTEK